MATAIKKGFSQVYERNEKAHTLPKKDLEGLIMQITGLAKSNRTVRAIVETFGALKACADFSEGLPAEAEVPEKAKPEEPDESEKEPSRLGLNLSYTINLVLPKTDDVAVFNAIFKSLKDNLLKK